MALPSGFKTKIKSVELYGQEVEEASPQMSVTITLEDEIDISRGDMIVRENNQPIVSQDIECYVAWMDDKNPLKLKGKYAIKHTSKDVRCVVSDISYKMDVNNLSRITENFKIELNDIGRIKLRTTKPLFYDSYRKNRLTGSFILIDEATNITVGACMII
jgi:sulfate adenylyltransferase subunit 1